MLSVEEKQALADLIANAIKSKVIERGSFPDGGCILTIITEIPKDDSVPQQSNSYSHYIRDDIAVATHKGSNFASHLANAAMKLSNAMEAYSNEYTLLSGVSYEVAKHSEEAGFINQLGGIIAIVEGDQSNVVISWAPSGDTERENLICAAAAIDELENINKFKNHIKTPTCYDINNAISAYDIAETCRRHNLRRPLIIGRERAMCWEKRPLFWSTFRAKGIAPVYTDGIQYAPTIELIRKFVNDPEHRDPNSLPNICDFVKDADLTNEKRQPKDCVIVVECDDLVDVLSPYLRGQGSPQIINVSSST